MIVTLKEAKKYLRVDHDDDDSIIRKFIRAAEMLCEGTLRKAVEPLPINKVAVLFAVAYVDTAGKNANRIAEYIKRQLEEDRAGEQLTMGNY